MPLSKSAKFLCVSMLLATLTGCASTNPDWDESELWYEDVKPLDKAEGNGAVYDSRRHGLLLGVGNKFSVGDLIVVKVEEQTDSMDSLSNAQKKTTSYDAGLSFGMDGQTEIEGDVGVDSSSSFSGSGKSSKSHSLTSDITVVVRKVMPNGNLVVEGQKVVELSNGKEVIGMRGIVRETDISTVNNSVPSGRVANAHIYYKGVGDSDRSGKTGILYKITQSGWWPI